MPLSTAKIKLLNNNIPLEAELMLCCARTQVNPSLERRIAVLAQQNLDWDYLLRIAEKHKVIQLLYKNLSAICSEAIPPKTFRDLRSRFLANANNNLFLTHQLLQLLSLFQQHQIRAIPYKGTVLANSIYGKQSLRQVRDIDLLVDLAGFTKTKELLLSLGYFSQEQYDREECLVKPEPRVEVDLHWGFTPFYFPLELDFERLWQRTQTIKINQVNILTFATEDLLLILCIQVGKDSWERQQQLEHLAKVCDLAELIKSSPDLDWSLVTEQAKQIGAVRILHFGLILAWGLMDVDLPSDIEATIQADLTAISLAKQVCAPLFTDTEQLTSRTNHLFDFPLRIRQLVFYLNLRESPRHKIEHLGAIVKGIVNINN